MTALCLSLPAIALLTLGAHFFRAGQLSGVFVCLALLGLLLMMAVTAAPAAEFPAPKDGSWVVRDFRFHTGEVLPDGAEGELVFTTLTKEALPVVRYRTRDLTRLLPPTARSMRRIGKIVGRSDDMLIIRGVNVFPTQIEELILQNDKLSGQYQIVVKRNGHLDQMTVRSKCGPTRVPRARPTAARSVSGCSTASRPWWA